MKTFLVLIPIATIAVSVAACSGDDTVVEASGNDAGTNGGDSAANDAASTDAATSADAASTGDSGAVTFTPGAPITGLTPGSWTWVDVAGTKCRDGSASGIGVSPAATTSNKLMIFLEGGGACFNSTTCGGNPATYGALQFAGFPNAEGIAGIFSRADAANAVKDWNMVYVPYCTGDVHGGSATDVTVPGVVGTQQFVGYDNMTRDLERIVPTFTGTNQVLLTGQSAGGFGAALNYVQTARAFSGGAPVTLIDDSGPLMANPTLASCLESSMLTLWGMSSTVIRDCGTDCSDPGNALSQYWVHLPKTYPSVPFTVIDSTGDGVISNFFGFGASNCTTYTAVTPEAYEAAMIDMRTKVSADPSAGLFLFAGTDHTSLVQAYTTRTAPASDGGTAKLEDWVSAVVNGAVTNVGP
ncbi:MAG: pectin acetylesterase-family hydrolase [Polyangiaceae bacterium]